MEESIAFFARNLETHEDEALSRDNWLLAFAAVDSDS
jgi:hypothetical protein